jgi:hypothetical protein
MAGYRKPWLDEDDEDAFDEADPRPVWERLDPREGVPAWEALFHFVDREQAEDLFELDLEGYGDELNADPDWPSDQRLEFDRQHHRWRMHRLRLGSELWGKLLRGELVALGFSNQSPLDAPRRPVIAERWRDLELDVKASRAAGAGVVVTQIIVFAADKQSVSMPESPIRRYSPTALRDWYVKRVESCLRSGRQPSREDDYSEANTELSGSIPKRAVEALRRELAPEEWTRKRRRRNR